MSNEKKSVPSVSVTYARNGSSTKINALGMRPMQERAYPSTLCRVGGDSDGLYI